ncbi:MAG: hypothetical protein JWL94_90 [Microbacteriaceae bacterium]|jgi:hypothetical protein|nr:hypothetical protein [Microbacteriaceae bacterium]HEV7956289.1 hypothetical protein [Marisediminicola sp.]
MKPEMMNMFSMEMEGMDVKMMQECMEACSAAEQACTMCADASSGDQMARMASMCMTNADMCNTMMRMMMRSMGHDMGSMMAMLEACMMMNKACADACMANAEMSDHAKMCAQVCMDCANACEAMMTSMKPSMAEMPGAMP